TRRCGGRGTRRRARARSSGRPFRGATGARAAGRPRRPRWRRAPAPASGTARRRPVRPGGSAAGVGGSSRSPGCGRGSWSSRSAAVPGHAREAGIRTLQEDGSGMGKAKDWRETAQRLALALALGVWAGCEAGAGAGAGAPAGERAGTEPEPAVRLGIDVLMAQGAGALEGMRVGLITNHTGRDAQGRSTIDLLHGHPRIELVALFSPEHGIRGTARPGERVSSGRDEETGLPIHSLYGETREPTAAMLEGLDALVFDIQDVGARYYTYVWTMTLAMQAAARHGLRFVVLDRPNPIGGELVQGTVLEPAHATFVGLYPVPMRHGLTAGELARLANEEFGIGADLEVVRMEGWRRSQWWDETGLPWTPPSPNMPDLESATHYPGTCLFEGTNLSVGRGTSAAFQQIGAPWLDHETLA